MTISLRERALLAACTLLVLVPGLQVSLFDRDEGWYGQVVREMLAGGDWLVPTYLGQPWLLKPPLVYWLAAALAQIFGLHEWVLRGVSVAATVITVQLLATVGGRLFDARTGRLAALIFVTAGLPALIGRMFLMDNVMLALLMGATLVFERCVYDRLTWSRTIAFWLLVGLAALTKGPAIAVYVGGLLLAGWWAGGRATLRSPQFWSGALLGLLPAVGWFAAVALHAGGDLWQHYFLHELFSRFSGPAHGHVGPPGYYALFALLGFLPWTIAAPRALVEAWRLRAGQPATAFVLWWLVLPWLALELIPGKLPHYWIPCYAPFSLLIARLCLQLSERLLTRAEQRAVGAWAGTPLVLGVVLVGFALWPTGAPTPVRAGFVAAGAVLIGGVLFWLFRPERYAVSLVGQRMAGVMVAGWAVFGALVLPPLEPHRLSVNVAKRVNVLPKSFAILAAGFDEPTLFFYLARLAEAVNPKSLREALAERPALPILVLGSKQYASIERPERWSWQSIRGLHYVRGAFETVWIGTPIGD